MDYKEVEDDAVSSSSDQTEEAENESDEEYADSEDENEEEDGELDGDEKDEDVTAEESSVRISNNSTAPGQDTKSRNVADLVRGNLTLKRQPLLPRILSVSEGAAVARKPFKPPCRNGYTYKNEELGRRLWARKRFVPWGSARPVLVAIENRFTVPSSNDIDPCEPDEDLPPEIEPLILWEPEVLECENGHVTPIVVSPLLVKYLRPHQREGVQFMFECVSGLSSADGIAGCILADDMGLGKTLQSITLLYTLLCQGFDGKPMVKRALIVTPTSLVSNWESEIIKWVGGRIKVLPLCESTRADVVSGVDSFLRPSSAFQVLIISYETFRMHSSKFERAGSCDLLICDEAHRLKNDQTLTNRALAALPCRRRILLSGTPMQNDLEEFYAMVNFTNPGILGDATHFRRYYEVPIICGREPTATIEERKLGAQRSGELSTKVNKFILRRTNTLLSNHLPPKIVEVVCCRLTPLQLQLYYHFIQSKNVKHAIADDTKKSKILAYITALKKLCNHPKLIYDTIKSGNSVTSEFQDCLCYFPPELFSGRSGSWTGGEGVWVELSGKMHVLARLLAQLRLKTNDRIVLVSNYTQTLDLFAQLCRERRYPYLRLDGTTSIGKRQKLVNRFNDFSRDEFVFLLSSKAGGCGLNLIGGNRLVLFDPDWNPANDKQAAARVWRDGQKKRVYVYRFLSTGTIEEKVYQRQMSKEGLQKVIQQENAELQLLQGNSLSTEELRDLFTLSENVRSEIHEKLNCLRCPKGSVVPEHGIRKSALDSCALSGRTADDIGGFAEISGCLQKLTDSEKQIGAPLEEDLGNWGHHISSESVPDAILQAAAGDDVTFVFTNQIDGKLAPVDSEVRPLKKKGMEPSKDSPSTTKIPQLARPLMKPNFSRRNSNSGNSTPTIACMTERTVPTKLPRTSTGGFAKPRPSDSSNLERLSSPLTAIPAATGARSDDDFQ